jgi:hypothetical protein
MKITRCTCGFEMWDVGVNGVVFHICRRCDTVAQGGGRRVGPPNSPNTQDGWFSAPFGDNK